MEVIVLKKGKTYSEGVDPFVHVEVADHETGEKACFSCRNIFDFGYVVNPLYSVAKGYEPGGTCIKREDGWYWSTMQGMVKMTEFEVKAVSYLMENPPIDNDIRM